MASFIEDYALLSDMNTGALVSRAGSIDWFCAPRFDSGAVFAALLGDREHGRWLLAPLESVNPAPVEEVRTERSYRENTFTLQTIWHIGDASVRVTDFMPLTGGTSIVRNVEGLTGEVVMLHELTMRFDNGKTTPWVTRYTDGDTDPMVIGMAGPHALVFRGDTIPDTQHGAHTDTFVVSAGQHYSFSLSYFASNHNPPAPIDYDTALTYANEQWSEWSELFTTGRNEPAPETSSRPVITATEAVSDSTNTNETAVWATRSIGEALNTENDPVTNTQLPEIDSQTYHELAQTATHTILPNTAEDTQNEHDALYREARLRALLTLRALISRETGGLVGALTTSLPETLGGSRNWDFRFSWLRDVAMAMDVTLTHGHERETAQLRNWILRAVANNPQKLHAVYGVAGEKDDLDRRLALPGYEGSQPVRSGNGSGEYFQADALGQMLVTFANLRHNGVGEDHLSWPLQKELLNSAVERIGQADRSLWEMRAEPRIYTHSQVMLWAAFNAGVSAVEDYGLAGDGALWAHCRDSLAEEILEHGYNPELNSFVQTYDGTTVDASLLQLPQVGFLDWSDERMLGTVRRIEQELQHASGMIYRYINRNGFDGFEDQDNLHCAASLWLAEQYIRSGREQDGRRILDTVLGVANDLNLMSSEYDFTAERMTGNFPHSLAHISLIRTVEALGL
ncbi:glycoside hydrolase family 15 protein [Rothia sp. CCM 9419]|uniref:glycoside hydrolase family 15 protein n=1 Tax=Rothia sp. CCM 9419 TaxID=3402662 RepID=UPI003AE4031F